MAKSTIKNQPDLVRISPRITRKLSIVSKYVYAMKGVTLEDRVSFLIQKDIDNLINQKWYKEHLAKNGGEEESLNYIMKYMTSGKRDENYVPIADPLSEGEE